MPFDGAPQAPELLGMGVAACLAAQFFPLFDEGLLERDPGELGGLHYLAPGDLQEPAIDRVGDGFLLDGAVNDDPFELGGAYRFGRYRRVNGGFEQFFDTGFADRGAKPSDLGGIAGQLRFVVGLAAEVLPYDVLGPAFDDVFIAEVVGVLEVQQRGHQPDRQARASGGTLAASSDLDRGTEQIAVGDHLPVTILTRKGRREGRFNLRPR